MNQLLKPEDLIERHIYSAKRPRRTVSGIYNDRLLLRVLENSVQYDSPTVAFGRRFPVVSKEVFLKWAHKDVTEKTPEGGWRTEP